MTDRIEFKSAGAVPPQFRKPKTKEHLSHDRSHPSRRHDSPYPRHQRPRANHLEADAMTGREKIALGWLAGQSWKTAWWGGKPHGRWPREMSGATLERLRNQGFAVLLDCRTPFLRVVRITSAGREALEKTS